MKQKLLILLFMAFIPITIMAYDVTDGDFYFNLNTEDMTAEVTYKDTGFNSYSGNLSIPPAITLNNKTYDVTSIGDLAFALCSNLTSIDIPNSVTSIGEYAFSQCSNLTSIEIPNSVTSIGEYAFGLCSNLTSIDIPNSVTSIGNSAFSNCSSLTSVNIPNSLTSIENNTFYCCSSLSSITIPNSITSIDDYAFADCGLTTIEIPNSVTKIGAPVFSGCSNLESITVDPKNTKYDSRNNCNAIIETSENTFIAGCKKSFIPNNVTRIENYAFFNCIGLTSVDIPNNVTSIGNCAFTGCSDLTTIKIGNGITKIGSSAFYNCKNLEVLTCHATTVPSTDTYTFDNANVENATLIVPDESYTNYETTAPWSNFGTILKLSETVPSTVTINISSAGIATYCSEYDLDFSETTDLKAYIAPGFNVATGSVKLMKVTDPPAGTGIIIKGDPGNYDVKVDKSSSCYGQLLVGVTEPITLTPSEDKNGVIYTNFVLSKKSGKVGFYTLANSFTYGPNKAYLQIPSSMFDTSAGYVGLEFEDETDVINNVENSETDGMWYTISGMRVDHLTKGVYIHNGKKLVIK